MPDLRRIHTISVTFYVVSGFYSWRARGTASNITFIHPL